MFKTNSFKTIGATLVSASMLLGTFLASPVISASAKVELEDIPAKADYQESKGSQTPIVSTSITSMPYSLLLEPSFSGVEGAEVWH